MQDDMNPFALLSVLPAYNLDWEMIDRTMSALQETLHPDLYPAGSHERDIADTMLSKINNAYVILKDPIQRARALFDVKNMSVPGEKGQTISDPEMMEEALLLKESLEAACFKNEFEDVLKTLDMQKDTFEEQFNEAFLSDNKNNMNVAYIRLSFCIKTLNDAKALCFENRESLRATAIN